MLLCWCKVAHRAAMPPVELPVEVWKQIATLFLRGSYGDGLKRYGWKGAAIISSMCRATRHMHHSEDHTGPSTPAELTWFVRHAAPRLTHVSISLEAFTPESFSKNRLRLLALCLQRFREVHIGGVSRA